MNAESAVINYFKYKEIYEPYKFGYYKRIIGYILDTTDQAYIRKIFLLLVNKEILLKIKNVKKSYKYQFVNEKKNKQINKQIDKKIFTIDWT